MQTIALETAWPSVQTRLATLLRRRGVPHEDAQEIIQEVAVRVLKSDPDFHTAKDLEPWAVTVALNLWRDRVRSEIRHPAAGPVPDVVTAVDVEEQVMSRFELRAAFAGMAALTVNQRGALLDELEDADVVDLGDRRLVNLRYRARARLREAVGSFGAWVLRSLHLPAGGAPAAFAGFAVGVAGFVGVAGVAYEANEVWQHHGEHAPARDIASNAIYFHKWASEAEPGSFGPTVGGVSTDPGPRNPLDPRQWDPVVRPTDGRPEWAGREPGEPTVYSIPNPTGGSDLYRWTNDTQHDDDPVLCAWSQTVDVEACTPVHWGDVRDHSPVPIDPPY